jgi:hypothetical protein
MIVSAAAGSPSDVVKLPEVPQESSSASQMPQPPVPEVSVSPAQLLSSQELAEMAKRAEEPGQEVVGGALSNLHLTYIVIALAAAVLVLILK